MGKVRLYDGKFFHIRVKKWHLYLYLHFYSAPPTSD